MANFPCNPYLPVVPYSCARYARVHVFNYEKWGFCGNINAMISQYRGQSFVLRITGGYICNSVCTANFSYFLCADSPNPLFLRLFLCWGRKPISSINVFKRNIIGWIQTYVFVNLSYLNNVICNFRLRRRGFPWVIWFLGPHSCSYH